MTQPALDHRVLRLGRLELNYDKPHIRAGSLNLREARQQADPRLRMVLAGSSWVGRVCENHGSWQGPERERWYVESPRVAQPSLLSSFSSLRS